MSPEEKLKRQLASVVLGYRIGAGEWPWKREGT